MKRSIQLLSLMVVVQVALVVGFSGLFKSGANVATPRSLIAADIQSVDRITLIGEDTVELRRNGETWQLSGYSGLPADLPRVRQLLDDLGSLTIDWPVATTASAAKRFEVAADNPATKITLATGNEVHATLLFGTSPSFRKLHVRLEGEDDVYAVDLAQHRIPSENENWLDKDVVAASDTVAEIRSGAFTLVKGGDRWRLQGADSDRVDQEAVEAWVDRFQALSVLRLAPEEAAQDLLDREADAVFTLVDEADTRDYHLFKQGEKYFVRADGNDSTFEISNFIAEPLLSANMEQFLVDKEEFPEGSPEGDDVAE